MKNDINYLSRIRIVKDQCIFAAVFMVLGGLLYLFLRPVQPDFMQVFSNTEISKWIEFVRSQTLPFSKYVPDWIIYSGPNAFWAVSYTLLILNIWRNSDSKLKYIWYISIPVLIFGFEFLQYSHIVRGTFSILDLLAGFIGILAGIMIEPITTKTYNYEDSSN